MEPIESRVKDFLESNPTFKIVSNAARIEMQQLHNEIYVNNKEFSRNCSACRARMHRKLKAYVFNQT